MTHHLTLLLAQRRWSVAATLLAALGVALFAASRSDAADDAAKNAAPKPALTVTTVMPRLDRQPLSLPANGNIVAWQEASVGAEANGLRLAQVRVNVGDVVRAGQVLASFAPETVQADLAVARANLLEAEASAAEAQGNAERARSLQNTGALSTQQINQYTTAAQTAQARVEAAKAQQTVQQVRLRNTSVLAPDAGVISARTATVGAVVPAGTELFRLIRKGRLEWRAEVTAAELARLKAGTPALITLPSGTQIKGSVRMIAPTVDAQTRVALVYVDLPDMRNLNAPARAGMFVRGNFELGESSALMVPQTAVVVRDGFSYVFRVGADNRVARLKVTTGRIANERIEITSALAGDARLVATGAGFLNDGDLVRVVEDGGRAAPAAAPAPASSTPR